MIFDVDGTLVDSNDAHAAAFVEAFAQFGFQVGFEEVRRLIGEGSDKLIPRLIGPRLIHRCDAAIAERKKAIFMARHLPNVRPFPAVDTLLERLKAMGLRLAVASSATDDELDALLEIARARSYFAVVTDSNDAERSKPDPDIVLAALDKLRLAAERCVMVGDTPYDAAAARRAGVPFVGVRCGGWADGELRPAIGVYDDPAELLEKLLKDPGCALRTPS